jgi:predicted glycoside hydrolase/deacetylase ChbG (UPF0249 family)
VIHRQLIVNADDFGLSPGVNRGVLRAHECGVVTSASLLVRRSHAEAAVFEGRGFPELSLGLHLDLGEWIWRDGSWTVAYEVVPAGDAGAVGEEFERQLKAFRRMVRADPTHIDSHQHAHFNEPVRSIVLEAAARLGIPARGLGDVRYCGDFYGQTGRGEPFPEGITVNRLLRILDGLGPGATELGCHPGAGADAGPPYAAERSLELVALCDPRVRCELAARDIDLVSHHQLEEGAHVPIA